MCISIARDNADCIAEPGLHCVRWHCLFPAERRGWETQFAVAEQRLHVAEQAGRNRVLGKP